MAEAGHVADRPVVNTTWRDWLAFWILGTVNNLGYVVVLSGAKSLADSFGDGNLIGVLNWADVALGLAVKSANAMLFQGTSFHVRMGVNSCVGALGVLGVALSGNISFAFAVASVTLIGTMSSFGESVLLGYLKYYPASMTGAWSSGTGAAGVVGSAFYLALHGAGVSNTIIFYTMLPPILAYWWAFAWLLKKPETATSNGAGRRGSYSLLQTGAAAEAPRREVEVSQHLTHDVNSVERGVSREPVAAQPQGGAGAAACVVDSGDGAGVVTLARAWKAIGLVWWHGVNLLLVYFFEYVVSVGGAAKANPPSTPSSSWWERNSYAILAFCYQFGVLLSRSSLSVVRIHKFGWLTLLQAVNFVLWLIQDEYHFAGLPIQFIAMVYVGLIGGGMYVNVFAELVEDPNIPPRDRELCINIASVFNNLGIVAASLFQIMMDNTFLKD